MGYTKPLVKAAGTAIQTGAEKVLRSLPVEQADFIAKTFNFKPGSPQDTFVRMGGIHPTDGPGIINSIQRGEAQDLPQHITNAVGGEPAALNEIGRFSDNGTNQVTEDTIKANQLQQANAKYESQVEPKAYNLSEGVEDFMGDTDVIAGRSWQQPDGELDQELNKLLAVKRGKDKGRIRDLSELSDAEQDKYKSLLATGPAQDADDILHYGFAEKPRAKTSQMEGSPGYSPQLHKSKEFHHKGMKSIQFGIFNRARQLVSEGKATTDDLLNLHALSNSMGAPSGSRKSAAEFMERFGHDVMHKQITLKKGVQPGGTRWTNEFRGGGKTKPKNITAKLWEPAKKAADDLGKDLTPFDIDYIKRQGEPLEKAIAKWKVFRKSKMYDALAPDGESEITRLLKKTDNMSIAELTQFQKEILEDITLPMQKEAVLMEEVMERLTPAQIFELQNTKNWQGLLDERRTLKDKKAAVAGAKSDKAERKFESAIEDYY